MREASEPCRLELSLIPQVHLCAECVFHEKMKIDPNVADIYLFIYLQTQVLDDGGQRALPIGAVASSVPALRSFVPGTCHRSRSTGS